MDKKLQIKICGLREPVNIDDVCGLQPDYIGFIFYPPSKRYIRDITDGNALDFIPDTIKRTGIFVNGNEEDILKAIDEYKLNALQLHGNESPDQCAKWMNKVKIVIKAFHIDENFNFANLEAYNDSVDYFLFDTKTDLYGGSGKKFQWDVLNKYTLNKPFFLSGGITPDDADLIASVKHPALYGIDLNSKFEDSPGEKNTNKLRQFLTKLYMALNIDK